MDIDFAGLVLFVVILDVLFFNVHFCRHMTGWPYSHQYSRWETDESHPLMQSSCCAQCGKLRRRTT